MIKSDLMRQEDHCSGAIKQLNGFSPMPKAGSKLAGTQIQLIETWIKEGIKNN